MTKFAGKPEVVAVLSLFVVVLLYLRFLILTTGHYYPGDPWAVEMLVIAAAWPILTVVVVKFWLVCRGERLRVHVLLVFVVIVLARGYELVVKYAWQLAKTTEFIHRQILP